MVNDASITGLHEKCIFNNIENFHIIENQSIDIMHDIFESVANYTIGNVLQAMLYRDKLFTLEMLNHRIETFNYGKIKSSDKPRRIILERCRDSKSKGKTTKIRLKQSSGEMMVLLRYLSLIIGDLVPSNNVYWSLYLVLRKIIGMVTSPRIVKGESFDLQELVAEHNRAEQHVPLFLWSLKAQNAFQDILP